VTDDERDAPGHDHPRDRFGRADAPVRVAPGAEAAADDLIVDVIGVELSLDARQRAVARFAPMTTEVPIRGEMIRLGQLLKLAGVLDTGAEVKQFLATRTVLVNGTPEDRRGRQLHPGDIVSVGDHELRVIAR
jgi:ribosome-associated protein